MPLTILSKGWRIQLFQREQRQRAPAGTRLLLLAFRFDPGDGRASQFYLDPIGADPDSKLNHVAVEADDGAIDAAVGHDLIAGLQGRQHRLRLLLSPLRGKNEQHIEDHHDDDQGQKLHDLSAGGLQQDGADRETHFSSSLFSQAASSARTRREQSLAARGSTEKTNPAGHTAGRSDGTLVEST